MQMNIESIPVEGGAREDSAEERAAVYTMLHDLQKEPSTSLSSFGMFRQGQWEWPDTLMSHVLEGHKVSPEFHAFLVSKTIALRINTTVRDIQLTKRKSRMDLRMPIPLEARFMAGDPFVRLRLLSDTGFTRDIFRVDSLLDTVALFARDCSAERVYAIFRDGQREEQVLFKINKLIIDVERVVNENVPVQPI